MAQWRSITILGLALAAVAALALLAAEEAQAAEVDLTWAGGYDTAGLARGVVVAGDYAYVADGPGGLVVVEVSDPTDPVRVGGYDTANDAWSVAVAGGYAYVADYSNGLVVVDVSDPADPTRVGGYDTSGYAYGVAVADGYAYVADYDGGLVVVNVSDPADPTYAGGYDTPSYAIGVAVADSYAYVTDYDGGLVVVDVSDPTGPTYAGGYDTADYAWGVAVAGGYAYVADYEKGLVVVDVSDPANSTRAGGYDTSSYAIGVAVAGDYAYVADAYGGLVVVDVSDSADPTRAGGYDTTGGAYGVAVTSDYAYVADLGGGLQILHINFPLSATIDSITPNPTNEGETVTFIGSGFGHNGTFAGYLWRSDLDGNLSTAANFTASLSPGNHTISFQVQDDGGAWSPWVITTLYVNARPVLSNGSVTPTTGGESTIFTFAVDYLDPDGGQNQTVQVTIAGFGTFAMVDPDGDGSFHYNTTLPWGYRNFSFSATDEFDASATSDTALHELLVNDPPLLANGSVTPATGGESTTFIFSVDYNDLNAGQTGAVWVTIAGLGTFAMADPDGDGLYHYETTLPWGYRNFSFSATDEFDASATGDTTPHELGVNARPTATIDASAPTNATFGEEVTFTGSADDPDGSISAWEWRSDRDGLLGTTATLTLSNLSAGTHNLTFRVQDNDGAWSEPATATLEVAPKPPAPEDDDGGGIPAPSLAATLAAVGVAVVARRRMTNAKTNGEGDDER